MTDMERNENLESPEEQNSDRNNQSGPDKPTIPSALANRGKGPRTPTGKSISKKNSSKHAIFSEVVAADEESPEKIKHLVRELRKYFKPVGPFEDYLVDKLVTLFWRLRRALLAEAAAGGLTWDLLNFDQRISEIDLLIRYGTAIDRAIDRTLAQLERAQRIRLGQQVFPQIDVNVSSS
jgi:hypothetical protein